MFDAQRVIHQTSVGLYFPFQLRRVMIYTKKGGQGGKGPASTRAFASFVA